MWVGGIWLVRSLVWPHERGQRYGQKNCRALWPDLQCEQELVLGGENLSAGGQGGSCSCPGNTLVGTHCHHLLWLPGVVIEKFFQLQLSYWNTQRILRLKYLEAALTGEISEVAKYSDAKYEQVHLNFNQTKVWAQFELEWHILGGGSHHWRHSDGRGVGEAFVNCTRSQLLGLPS